MTYIGREASFIGLALLLAALTIYLFVEFPVPNYQLASVPVPIEPSQRAVGFEIDDGYEWTQLDSVADIPSDATCEHMQVFLVDGYFSCVRPHPSKSFTNYLATFKLDLPDDEFLQRWKFNPRTWEMEAIMMTKNWKNTLSSILVVIFSAVGLWLLSFQLPLRGKRLFCK